ncbi:MULTISPECIES: hypothetical protein [Calothrix]|uniref:Large polyvalent protein associated domain-containing protein n=2 Tax=Calothrix TaxID=1186 RepID=A0ABR8AJK7_9CYAN|nr:MULTISPECIES: hypothetical protein [Calothrix]MBD2200148.1 hypothetical protein [Calothrix parietina FACHB-288]MBD2229142.1 hypothetical protein [Calothrix anomala FACHB-343]
MSNICNNNPTELEREKYNFNTKEGREKIAKAVEETHRRNEMLARLPNNAEEAQALKEAREIAKKEEIWQQRVGEVVSIDPSQSYKIQTFLAVELGALRKFDLFNPSLEYSIAGEVKKTLVNAKRSARSTVSAATAYTSSERISKLRGFIHANFGEKLSSVEIRELMVDVLEIGNIPKRNTLYGDTDGVKIFNEIRYDRFVNKWKAKGLDEWSLTLIKGQASNVSTTFTEANLAAKAVGYDVEQLANLGYFPHIYKKDALEKIGEAKAAAEGISPKVSSRTKVVSVDKAEFGSKFETIRNTNHYVPAHLDVVSELLGVPRDDLARMITNGEEWNELLKKVPASTLDTLVDSGVIQQIPMSMSEIITTLNKEYSLGFGSLDELFITDPQQALNKVSRDIEKATQNWSMTQTVFSGEAIKQGWAITGADFANLADKNKKNFINFAEAFKVDEKDAINILNKFFTPEQQAAMQGMYVHKTVARNLAAQLEISSSAAHLSNVSRYVTWWGKYLKGSALLGSNIQFITRNLMDGMISLVAAGGHLHDLVQGFAFTAARRMNKLSIIDNTKVFRVVGNKKYTKLKFAQEVWARLDNSIPGIDKHSGINWGASLSYIKRYSDVFKDPVVAKELGSDFLRTLQEVAKHPGKSASNTFFKTVGTLAEISSFVDEWMKFTVALSVAKRNTWGGLPDVLENVVSLNLKRPDINSFEELDRWIGEYFPSTDMAGTLTKKVDQYVIPFFTWRAFSLGSTIRMAMRNPQRFLAYQRLSSLFNQANGINEIPEVGLNEYENDEPMVLKRRDPNTGHIMVMFPSNYDRTSDTLSFVDIAGKHIQRALGFYPGTSTEQRKQAMGETDWTDAARAFFGSTYYDDLVYSITGRDKFTGEKIDNNRQNTFLGLPVPKAAQGIVTTLIPLLDVINRTNPGDVFGRREITDSKGNVIVPGKPSWAGYSRTDKDAAKLAWEKGTNSEKVDMLLGKKYRSIDTKKNVQQAFTSIMIDLSEMQKRWQKESLYLSANRDKIPPNEFKAREAKLNKLSDTLNQTAMDARRIAAYMIMNDIPPSQVYREQLKQKIVEGNLPIVGQEELQRVIQEGQ